MKNINRINNACITKAFVVFLLCCSVYTKAQNLPPLSKALQSNDQKLMLHNISPLAITGAPSSPLFIKHKLPKGAVFCRMEEKIWHRFNVWVKLRAGSDEAYRQLIAPVH